VYLLYIMDIVKTLPANDNVKMDRHTFMKMSFIYTAVNGGWTVSKKKDKYVFCKPHEVRKEVFENSYLEAFVKTNTELISK